MGEDDDGARDGPDGGDAPETEPDPETDADAEDDQASAAPDDPEALKERVAELEAERDELQAELSDAEAEIEDLTERLQRKAADFENYKKRQQRRREEVEAAATESLLERLLDVRDNLKRATDQQAEDVESLREGVKLTLAELDKVLDAEDVSEIDPEPGTDVEPTRHEVMLRVESDQPADRIAEVYQPGYERGDKVLRPAQVTVSDGPTEEADDVEATGEADDAEATDGEPVEER